MRTEFRREHSTRPRGVRPANSLRESRGGACPLFHRTAFTLIEILIAAFILALLMTGLYKMFSSISRMHSMGAWSTQATNELRNGLNLVRQEISRATPPKMVTQAGSEDWGDPIFKKLYFYKDSQIQALKFPRGAGSADVPIVKFYMCQPGRDKIVGEPDAKPEIMQGVLKIQGNSLVYARTRISQDASVASKTNELQETVCSNLGGLGVKVREAADLSVKTRSFLKLEVMAVHPRYPDTRVNSDIDAPFEVEAQEQDPLL